MGTTVVIAAAFLLGFFVARQFQYQRDLREGPSSQTKPYDHIRGLSPTQLHFGQQEKESLEEANVLLADGSEMIRKAVELTFQDSSAELTYVQDGETAKELLEKERFDIVIADVNMDGTSGYEVCEFVKQHDPSMPVLLLLATFEPFDQRRYMRCGADGLLKKPFDSLDLLKAVGGLLRSTTA